MGRARRQSIQIPHRRMSEVQTRLQGQGSVVQGEGGLGGGTMWGMKEEAEGDPDKVHPVDKKTIEIAQELMRQEAAEKEREEREKREFMQKHGEAYIFQAIEEGSLEDVVKLIHAGVDHYVRGTNERTILSAAAHHGQMEILQFLLQNLAHLIDVGDEHGMGPVSYAVESGHAEAVQLLLDNGANPFLKNEYGCTPMSIAWVNNDKQCLEILHKHGCEDPTEKEKTTEITRKQSIALGNEFTKKELNRRPSDLDLKTLEETRAREILKKKQEAEAQMAASAQQSIMQPRPRANARDAEGMDTSVDLSRSRQEYILEIANSLGERNELLNLNLSICGLKDVPEGILKLTNLLTLNVSGNCIKELTYRIDKLKHLVSLNLSRNLLKDLPLTILRITSLSVLDLSKCRLSSLGPITKLKMLQELNLANNDITTVDSSIGDLQELRVLSLSYNNISYFPRTIRKLRKLVTFSLAGNYLQMGEQTRVSQKVWTLQAICIREVLISVPIKNMVKPHHEKVIQKVLQAEKHSGYCTTCKKAYFGRAVELISLDTIGGRYVPLMDVFCRPVCLLEYRQRKVALQGWKKKFQGVNQELHQRVHNLKEVTNQQQRKQIQKAKQKGLDGIHLFSDNKLRAGGDSGVEWDRTTDTLAPRSLLRKINS
eukprot:Nk52_evm16s1916 gene=Nk52_evmTU16s1916